MAATAYAAVVSLRRVLEDILHHPPQGILLDTQLFQSLLEKIISFQHFLEDFDALPMTSKPEAEDGVEGQLAKACYAAEDIIESFVLDQILAPSKVQVERILTCFVQDFPKVMQDVDSVEKKVVEVKGKMGVMKDQQPVSSLPADGLSGRLAPTANDTTTGLDSHLFRLKERLVGDEPKLQLVSIVGMGGIGKTTLARTVYDDLLIVEKFEIRAWVTISQEYDTREILLALLHVTEIVFGKRKQEDSVTNFVKFVEGMSKHSDEQLGEQLRKNLYGRKYLIVMDDMWSTKVWNEVRKYFPDTSNQSRVMITTRLSNVAVDFDSEAPHEMDFLDEDKSWNLFCEKVFRGEPCPPELEEIGKQIAKSCKGLPLALVVIGGLLAKSQRTIVQWKYVAENLVSVINLGNHEQCLKILSLSYSHLPIHLKPCFLYLAIFPEDFEIHISRLIELWITEGFVNPVAHRSLEDIAAEYLKELIDRNLLIVRQRGTLGKMKSCIIHDLLRDLCLREALKDHFLCIAKVYDVHFPPNMENKRRLGVHRSTKQYRYNPRVLNTLRSASSSRSLVCESEWISPWLAPSLKLLRVLNVKDKYSPEEILQLINSRYLHFSGSWDVNSRLTSSISLLWNLQTLIVRGSFKTILPSQVWEMTQLRHLKFGMIVLSDPLRNLIMFAEEVPERIPNIKKMKLAYANDRRLGSKLSSYGLQNLACLSKLESLTLDINWREEMSAGDFGFPHSLKKLTLSGCGLPWKDMRIVGSLPKLEILRLHRSAFVGRVWNPSEGEFARLKFLKISETDLTYWGAENTHFPSLEHLVLSYIDLKELPMGLAEIHTLQLIEMEMCTLCDGASVKQISEERESLDMNIFTFKFPSMGPGTEK
ncbi:UNVERIFIED_CONTAM: Disease resistance protein RPP13 [Sesamum latifolium]|uniref:Disease resistance protein RPP13 n=1 Tax=Sesamum latifolium TaxID=2727402 RepID=A0AAW2UF99_9LAMI